MKEKLAALLAASLIACNGANCKTTAEVRPTQEEEMVDVQDNLEELVSSVYCIRAEAEYTNETTGAKMTRPMHGTGFAYAKRGNTTYIITNNHVVTPPETAAVPRMEATETSMNIVVDNYKLTKVTISIVDNAEDTTPNLELVLDERDSDRDIAILATDKNIHCSDKAYETGMPTRIGDRTYTIGFPLGAIKNVDEGIISSDVANINGRPHLLTDTNTTPGYSGSPVFVRSNNRLYWIGLTQGKLNGADVGLVIPIEEFDVMIEGD